MSQLITELESVLPKNITMPPELKLLYRWIENRRFFFDRNGMRHGYLFPLDLLNESITEKSRKGGTNITFSQSNPEDLQYWFGKDDGEIKSRLCVFARSGSDGSQCALWKNDQGDLKIVHMGSGSGSTLSCVLSDNVIDFIRLLAIGYDEICWEENFSYPPSQLSNFLVEPNFEFQNWVIDTFAVDIPKTASEIVKHPARMDDETSEDEFFNWVYQLNTA